VFLIVCIHTYIYIALLHTEFEIFEYSIDDYLMCYDIPSGVEPNIATNLLVQRGCHGFHACDHENQVHEKNYQVNLLNQNMNDAEKSNGSIKPTLI